MSTTNVDMRRTDRGVYSNDIHRAEAAMTEEEHKREVLAGIDAHTVTNTLMRTFGLIPETDDGSMRPIKRRDTGNYSSVPTANRVIDRETGNYSSVPAANGVIDRETNGARHVHNTILKSRYLTDELKKVVDPSAYTFWYKYIFYFYFALNVRIR
ncbi:hypothetical protein Btru_043556 [Bulinus truncatus]|nr:hypothetical protein Btru_043556 [Bulinus truncatus]